MTDSRVAAALRDEKPKPADDDEYHPGWCPWCGAPVGVCDGDCDPEDDDDD